MLNITNYQRNANQNFNLISPHTGQNNHHQKVYSGWSPKRRGSLSFLSPLEMRPSSIAPSPAIHDPLIFGLGGLWPKPLRDPHPLCPSSLRVGPTPSLDNLAQSLNFQTMRSSGPHYVTTRLHQPWRAQKLILPSEHMAPLVPFFPSLMEHLQG